MKHGASCAIDLARVLAFQEREEATDDFFPSRDLDWFRGAETSFVSRFPFLGQPIRKLTFDRPPLCFFWQLREIFRATNVLRHGRGGNKGNSPRKEKCRKEGVCDSPELDERR